MPFYLIAKQKIDFAVCVLRHGDDAKFWHRRFSSSLITTPACTRLRALLRLVALVTRLSALAYVEFGRARLRTCISNVDVAVNKLR